MLAIQMVSQLGIIREASKYQLRITPSMPTIQASSVRIELRQLRIVNTPESDAPLS